MGICIVSSTKDPHTVGSKQSEGQCCSSQLYQIAHELDQGQKNNMTKETHIVRFDGEQTKSLGTTNCGESSEIVAEPSTSMKKSRFFNPESKTSPQPLNQFISKVKMVKTSTLHSKIRETSKTLDNVTSGSSSKKPKTKKHPNSLQHKDKHLYMESYCHRTHKHEQNEFGLNELSVKTTFTTKRKRKSNKYQTEHFPVKKLKEPSYQSWIDDSQISIGLKESSIAVRPSIRKDERYLECHLLPQVQTEDSENFQERQNQQKKLPKRVCYKDGSFYEGEWKEGKMNGKGKYVWGGGVYKGHWKNNEMDGQARIVFQNGQIFEGHFVRHRAQGHGTFFFRDESVYRGNWIDNKRNGQGIQEWPHNEHYKGNWVDGNKEGLGELTYEDGSYYRGLFKDNEWQGQGEYEWIGHYNYKGHWQHNKKEGRGIQTFPNGEIYEGDFSDDKMQGHGKFTHSNGVVEEGLWQKGRKEGLIEQFLVDGTKKKGMWVYGKLFYEE